MITVVDADLSSINASVTSDREVIWHISVTVLPENDLAFQESSLRDARVDLLGLSDHDRLVFQVVVDGHLPDAIILEAALDDVLLEVTIEAEDLLVELDEVGLIECLDVLTSEVVGELVVRVRHALGGLGWDEPALSSVGDGVERHGLVLNVLDLAQMHVGDLLVAISDGRVVRRSIPG